MASSLVNKKASKGKLEGEVKQLRPASNSFAMSPENHAIQVFDLLKEGKFYLVTDNVKPYVDHNYPFEARTIIRERFQNLDNLELDNSDAFVEKEQGSPTSILKGAMFQEIQRLNEIEN